MNTVMPPNDLSFPSKRQMPNFQPFHGGLPPLNVPSAPFVLQGGAPAGPIQAPVPSQAKPYQRPSNSYVPIVDDHRNTPNTFSQPFYQQPQYATSPTFASSPPNRNTSDANQRSNLPTTTYAMQSYGTATAPVLNSSWRNDPHSSQNQGDMSRSGHQYPSPWFNGPPKDPASNLGHPYGQSASPVISSHQNSWSGDHMSAASHRPTVHDHYGSSQQATAYDASGSSESLYGVRASSMAVGIPDVQASSPWTSTSVPLHETYPGGSRQNMLTGHSPTFGSSSTPQQDYRPGPLSQMPSYSSSTGASTSYHSPTNLLATPSSDVQSSNQTTPYGQWSLNSFVSAPSALHSNAASRGTYQDEESRWQGVATRSHHADKFYLYGALTTHIYCRPSCASKRPSRDRVQFFPYPDAAAAAEAAGFRSCKRCKPDRSGSDQTVLAVGDCVRHMMMAAASSAEEGGEPKKRTLKEYAARAGLSTFHFHRSLAKVMSITPGEYAKASQSMALQDALGIDNAPPGYGRISSKTYEDALTGWSVRRAKRALGNVDPVAYSSGDLGIPIVRTSIPDSVYGPICLVYAAGPDGSSSLTSRHRQSSGSGPVSRHDRAIYALLFGPDAEQRLTRRFPNALVGDLGARQEVASIVEDLRRAALREEQLPVETVASIRRARVWAVVRKRLANLTPNGLVGFAAPEGSGDDDGYE